MLYERLQREKQKITEKMNEIKEQLKELPEGKLNCAGNGNYSKWYQSDGKTNIYIPKKNQRLAEQLAAKKYLTLLEKDLKQENKAIESYLKNHKCGLGQAEQLLMEPSEYQNLLSPFFKPYSQELFDWQNTPFEHNTKYPEKLTIKTSSGNVVRSKSEALIDILLYKNRIPFRYECVLQLGKYIIYPDFTIRHPDTGELYYWEHFGKMDDIEYSKKAYSKLQLYNSHGIIPSIHLITTFETKENPLSTQTIEKIIEYYFG